MAEMPLGLDEKDGRNGRRVQKIFWAIIEPPKISPKYPKTQVTFWRPKVTSWISVLLTMIGISMTKSGKFRRLKVLFVKPVFL